MSTYGDLDGTQHNTCTCCTFSNVSFSSFQITLPKYIWKLKIDCSVLLQMEIQRRSVVCFVNLIWVFNAERVYIIVFHVQWLHLLPTVECRISHSIELLHGYSYYSTEVASALDWFPDDCNGAVCELSVVAPWHKILRHGCCCCRSSVPSSVQRAVWCDSGAFPKWHFSGKNVKVPLK